MTKKLSLWGKFRLYLKVRKITKEVGKMKAGWKTTEFWVTVFTGANGLIAQYAGFIPPPWGMIVAAIIGTGYTISRGLAKSNAPAEVPAPK